MSLPARGAWIEILYSETRGFTAPLSLPARGAWIEMAYTAYKYSTSWSLPARGAWIEMGNGLS